MAVSADTYQHERKARHIFELPFVGELIEENCQAVLGLSPEYEVDIGELGLTTTLKSSC